jgi:hypothetical protein
MSYLQSELDTASRALTINHLRALERLGVSRDTICTATRYGCLGVRPVTDAGAGLYLPDEDGEPHVIVPVWEDGALVDLCAFRTDNPTAWMLRSGHSWALGLERGLEPHTWGDPVTLADTPLDWLRVGGLCVLDWQAPEIRFLVGVPSLVCQTPEQASLLRTALTAPVRLPHISVLETRLAA